jgi:RimJ/RimL family protein N-acetyltransferase
VNVQGLEAVVVAGGSNPHLQTLQRLCHESGTRIQLKRDVLNMPELMAWADVAVSAAGSTCWEMCLLGLPAILVDVAENQRPVAKELGRRQIAIHLGSSKEISPGKISSELTLLLNSRALRAGMSQRARELVDGRGAERVVAAIHNAGVRLRRVHESDARFLWELANGPEVRAASFSAQTIPWESHIEWLRSRLMDPNSILYLAVSPDNLPIGHVRYQIQGERAAVSINLAGTFRGKGWGRRILGMGTDELLRSTLVSAIDAYVKPENAASIQLFARSGFHRLGNESISGCPAIHFVLERGNNGQH